VRDVKKGRPKKKSEWKPNPEQQEAIRQGQRNEILRQQLGKLIDPELLTSMEGALKERSAKLERAAEPFSFYEPKSFREVVARLFAGQLPQENQFQPSVIGGRMTPRPYAVSPDEDLYKVTDADVLLSATKLLDEKYRIPKGVQLGEAGVVDAILGGAAGMYLKNSQDVGIGSITPGFRSSHPPTGDFRTWHDEEYQRPLANKLNTLIHEITHAAQFQLPEYMKATQDFGEAYNKIFRTPKAPFYDSVLSDYHYRPVEVGARTVGEHLSQGLLTGEEPGFRKKNYEGKEVGTSELEGLLQNLIGPFRK